VRPTRFFSSHSVFPISSSVVTHAGHAKPPLAPLYNSFWSSVPFKHHPLLLPFFFVPPVAPPSFPIVSRMFPAFDTSLSSVASFSQFFSSRGVLILFPCLLLSHGLNHSVPPSISGTPSIAFPALPHPLVIRGLRLIP